MRLFAGIELDEPTRAICVEAQSRLQRAAFEAKYEAPEKLHVTLAFLGNVREELVPRVEEALETTAALASPFELTLDRLGAFPNERRPRIAFVGSRDQGAAFRTITQGLRDRYATMGFDFKDDAVAHVTIARVKGGSPRALPMFDVTLHVMVVSAIVLFESIPAEGTTRYLVRKRAPFSAAD